MQPSQRVEFTAGDLAKQNQAELEKKHKGEKTKNKFDKFDEEEFPAGQSVLLNNQIKFKPFMGSVGKTEYGKIKK